MRSPDSPYIFKPAEFRQRKTAHSAGSSPAIDESKSTSRPQISISHYTKADFHSITLQFVFVWLTTLPSTDEALLALHMPLIQTNDGGTRDRFKSVGM